MSKVITNLWKFLGIYLLCFTSARAQGVLRTAYPPLYRTLTTTDVPRTNRTLTEYSPTNVTTTKSPIIDSPTVSTLKNYVYYEHSDASSHKTEFGWVEFAAGHISALAIMCFVNLIWCVCNCSQNASRFRFRKSSYLTDSLPPGYDHFRSQTIESLEVIKQGEVNYGNNLDGKMIDDVTFPPNFTNKF